VKRIRSDNGSEFKNLQAEEFIEEEGIKNEFSAPYTPQQNGVVERKNRTLIDMTRTMLEEYKTPERFVRKP
jgi:transposase InsO family protein